MADVARRAARLLAYWWGVGVCWSHKRIALLCGGVHPTRPRYLHGEGRTRERSQTLPAVTRGGPKARNVLGPPHPWHSGPVLCRRFHGVAPLIHFLKPHPLSRVSAAHPLKGIEMVHSSQEVKEAKARMRELSAEAGRIADATATTKTPRGIARLRESVAAIETEMSDLSKIVKDAQFEKQQLAALGPHFADSVEHEQRTGRSVVPGAGVIGAAPSLHFDEVTVRGLHESLLSRKSFKAELKDAASSIGPAAAVPNYIGLVGKIHEPTRILDLIPTSTTGSPVIEYLQHTATSGGAGMVAAGGLKPTATLTVTKQTATVRKIAVIAVANDEDLADYGDFTQYLTNELMRSVIDTENAEILAGAGTGEHLLGLLNQTGILTRAVGTGQTDVDALEQAITDLRVGASYAEPTAIVLNPADWSNIRRTKDSQGNYLVQTDPTAGNADTLWGVPVKITTGMTAGTGLVLNAEVAAQAMVRQGITVQADFGLNGFEYNQTTFRVEERLTVFCPRPTAMVKVTGLTTTGD